jgi:hypothetical protein
VEHLEIDFACTNSVSQTHDTCKHAVLRTRTPTSAGMHDVCVLGMYRNGRWDTDRRDVGCAVWSELGDAGEDDRILQSVRQQRFAEPGAAVR